MLHFDLKLKNTQVISKYHSLSAKFSTTNMMLQFLSTMSEYNCLTSLTRAKPKEKMEFPT